MTTHCGHKNRSCCTCNSRFRFIQEQPEFFWYTHCGHKNRNCCTCNSRFCFKQEQLQPLTLSDDENRGPAQVCAYLGPHGIRKTMQENYKYKNSIHIRSSFVVLVSTTLAQLVFLWEEGVGGRPEYSAGRISV